MKISVVTVCFDSQATIARTVESFLKQDWPDKELLVVDGASKDDTVGIVKGLATAAVDLVSEPDRGIYDAMNKGLARFSGDAVGFLNSDDVFHDASALSRIAAELDRADATYGDLIMVKDQNNGRPVREWKAGDFHPGAFHSGWMPPHPTFYLRRQLAQAVGRFDLRYHISADYDFMLRALELHAPRVRYCRHTLVDFMVGGRSTRGLRSVVDSNLECLDSRRRHLGAPIVDFALFLKPLRKIGQLRRFS